MTLAAFVREPALGGRSITVAARIEAAAQRAVLQRQIDATDAEIDRLVYELYGLTAEEIAIVEGQSEPRQ